MTASEATGEAARNNQGGTVKPSRRGLSPAQSKSVRKPQSKYNKRDTASKSTKMETGRKGERERGR